ncbi:hypothetical protein ACWF94_31630 [Streptomyces sp. NPDC055078]
MTRTYVSLVLALGALEFRLRLRFPRLMWLLTTSRRYRHALLSDFHRIDCDPVYAAQWCAALDTAWEQRQIDRAFAELVHALTDESGPQ